MYCYINEELQEMKLKEFEYRYNNSEEKMKMIGKDIESFEFNLDAISIEDILRTKIIFNKKDSTMKNEVKLTVNGKEIRLTAEQIKILGLGMQKNPFDIKENEQFISINDVGGVHVEHNWGSLANSLIHVANIL